MMLYSCDYFFKRDYNAHACSYWRDATYICEHCVKSFHYSGNLIFQKRIHSGENIFFIYVNFVQERIFFSTLWEIIQ